MGERDAFERILESICDAMLDDARWPAASALIDEACGLTNNGLLVVEGTKEDARLCPLGLYYRGEPRKDLEREYLEDYHPADERVARFRRLADGRLVHVGELYTAEELRTSTTYNEMLPRAGVRDGLNARLEVSDGCHIAWCIGDPVDADGWTSSRITMITGLLPHIRQFIRVRQALVRAKARSTTAAALLDNPRIGVVQLDRRGGILEVNDRARSILRNGDGLSDRDGMLCTRAPDDQVRLERLLGEVLPAGNASAVSGSMLLRRSPVLPPFVVYVKPVGVSRPDYGARAVAALVLIVEPGRQRTVSPDVVARTLGLTPAESQVAVGLADGRSVRDLAEAAGHTEGAIYWRLNQIYRKLSISRQVDLVRLVLSLGEPG